MAELEGVKLFIDPSYDAYYGDILFDGENDYYNRDNCLAPWIFLKKYLEKYGCEVHTADYLLVKSRSAERNFYISLGLKRNCGVISRRGDTVMSAFFVFEPPVVAPRLYRGLKRISKFFRRVLVHTAGPGLAGYLKGINNAHKFFWPQGENAVREELWRNDRRKFLTLINGNKKPNNSFRELYGERIKAVGHFARCQDFDLYGFGWDKNIFYLPYILNRKAIRKSYRGPVKSKYEALGGYKFAVCFENMILDGYVTEKIFDCFIAGTVPVYLGAPDIEKYVPGSCFIDMRKFGDYPSLERHLRSLSDGDIRRYKEEAKKYLASDMYWPFAKEYFAESVKNIISEDLKS